MWILKPWRFVEDSRLGASRNRCASASAGACIQCTAGTAWACGNVCTDGTCGPWTKVLSATGPLLPARRRARVANPAVDNFQRGVIHDRRGEGRHVPFPAV